MFGLAALLLMAVPGSAVARSPAMLDCAVVRAPQALGVNLAAAMVAADRTRMGPLQEQLGRIVGQCVAANRLSDRDGETYYDYALARLPREALVRQLARAGIATARIDLALGFGPGQANRRLDESEVEAALLAAGIDKARIAPALWRKLLTYADLTARMHRYLAALG